MTTIKTLSEHLGLSLATVSRAMNGHASVSPDTRERVLQAARELNYRPNSSAQRLATGKTGAYGVILTTDENLLLDPHFADFMAGLTQELARRERDVVLTATLKSAAMATYERFARSGKVDGFVVSQPVLADPRVDMLTELGVPFVVHGRTGATVPYAFYDIDNFGALKRATELLVQLGHRRIAFLNGQPEATFAVHRREGHAAGLGGLPVDPALQAETPMTEEHGYRQARAMLERKATAIICSSILLALGAERAIRDAGLKVGADVSMICHDDGLSTMKTANFPVPLSVTRAPIRTAGQAIARMLEKLVGGAVPDSLQTVAQVELILRDSTNVPPDR